MRITPLDIRKQEFRRAMRGLDAEEVYAFLTTVADEYEAVLNDSKALKERLLELDDKVQEYRNMEKTLCNTLMTAERVNAESKENARREAGLIIKEAHIEAEKVLRNIRSDQMTLRNAVRELKRQEENYLTRMKLLAEAHLKFIESAERDLMDEEQAIDSPASGAENPVPPDASPRDAQERSSGIENRFPPGAFARGAQESNPVEIAGAEEFGDLPGEEGEYRPERGDGRGASDERNFAPFSDDPSPSPAASQAARSEVYTEPLFPMPPAEEAEKDGIPDLNDILDKLAAKQKQMYAAAPGKSMSAAPAKPEAAPAAPAKTPFGPARKDQSADRESAGSNPAFAQARKDPSPDAPHDGGEEWSLERLKRDILYGASGDNDRA
ncbi:MAG: DivIVA domain-containing protein [Chitinivibrionia bacterium]|nr:DivIVA domain-containing protein [Chitinivibrionia bacterium]